mgnify:CR=1 FL=1
MNDREKRITAYHEGGHALVAAAMRYTDPVTKVTILPRGRALGYTLVMPTEDQSSVTRNELLDQLAYARGGRVPEQPPSPHPPPPASNTIDKAPGAARTQRPPLRLTPPGRRTPTLNASAHAAPVPADTGVPTGRPVSLAAAWVTVPTTSLGQARRGSSSPGAMSCVQSVSQSLALMSYSGSHWLAERGS